MDSCTSVMSWILHPHTIWNHEWVLRSSDCPPCWKNYKPWYRGSYCKFVNESNDVWVIFFVVVKRRSCFMIRDQTLHPTWAMHTQICPDTIRGRHVAFLLVYFYSLICILLDFITGYLSSRGFRGIQFPMALSRVRGNLENVHVDLFSPQIQSTPNKDASHSASGSNAFSPAPGPLIHSTVLI